MTRILVLIAALALSGCATAGGGSYCGAAFAIRPTKADGPVISGQLTDQLLTHNKTGAKLCGWSK